MGPLRSLRRWKQKLAVAEKVSSLEWDEERVDSRIREDHENDDPKEVASPSSVRCVRVREEQEWVVHVLQEEICTSSSALHQSASDVDVNPISSPWFGACWGTSSNYDTDTLSPRNLGLGVPTSMPPPPPPPLVKTPSTL
eukprot:scaffold695384_cov43-Attheya_sp.AAC.1